MKVVIEVRPGIMLLRNVGGSVGGNGGGNGGQERRVSRGQPVPVMLMLMMMNAA